MKAEPQPPGPRRVVWAAAILLQAAAFGALSRTLLLPAAVAVAAVLGALPRERTRLSRARFLLFTGATGAACLALWRVLPHSRPGADMDPTIGSLGHALGQWALLGQAAALFLDWGADARGRPTLPAVLPAAGVAVLLSAGDVRATEAERSWFLLAAVAFALLCGVYWTVGAAGGFGWKREPGRWPRAAALLGVAAVIAGATWGASVTLRRYERTMDRVVRQFLQPEPLSVSAGFGGEARLGDVRARKQFAARAVALRCYADDAPGYLRGRAFYTLRAEADAPADATRWLGGGEERRSPLSAPLNRSRRGRPLDAGRTRFLFDFTRPAADLPTGGEPISAAPTGGRSAEVWPVQDFRGVLFVPPGTVRLTAAEPVLDADEYGLTLLSTGPQPHYAATTGPRGVAEWDAVAAAIDPADPRLTAVPAALADDPEVRAVADAIFAGRRTTAGKVAAVEDWFRSRYEYSFGSRIGSSGNPLREFLLRRPAAHCEYFATAAVVLLRMRGVPARYATGFVAAEANPVGGYWVARNADAHAWCEAWDPARGWVVVEATPAGGVPDGGGGANWFRQLWDAAAAALVRWRQFYHERGWAWLLGALAGLLTTGPGAVLAGLVAGLLGWRLRGRWAERRTGDPTRRAVRRLLTRADRRLARRGLVRAPGEPLHDFAARIAADAGPEAAAWYGAVADLLYRPAATLEEAAQFARVRNGGF